MSSLYYLFSCVRVLLKKSVRPKRSKAGGGSLEPRSLNVSRISESHQRSLGQHHMVFSALPNWMEKHHTSRQAKEDVKQRSSDSWILW